ncbi:MAG TPA: DNA translocase FtsK [bacterium]|nr:DNA translocase FtsK [bacterium]
MGRKRSESGKTQAAGAILLVLGLILGLSFLPKATGLPALLGHAQRWMLGALAAGIPVAVFLAGAILVLAGQRARFTRRIGAMCLLAVVVIIAIHARTPAGREFAAGVAGQGAGALGAMLVWLLRRALGNVGLWLVTVLGAAGAIFLWTGTRIGTVVEVAWALLTHAGRAAGQGLVFLGRAAVALLAALWEGIASLARIGAGRLRAAGDRVRAQAQLAGAVPRMPIADGPSVSAATAAAPPPIPSARAAGRQREAAEANVLPDVVTLDAPAPRSRPREPQAQQVSLPLHVPAGGFAAPPISLLTDLPASRAKGRMEPVDVARMLEQTLDSFGVEAKVVRWEHGPVVTRFEVQPAPGVRVQKISSLTNDIALALAAPSVRIEAPIPGKSVVGIELPNQKASLVHIKEILSTEDYQRETALLTVAIGKDIAGHPILADLAEMPHLLIAGATGSGKSVMLNAIIASLLFRCTPADCRLVMIDPKRVEFANFNNIPHLLAPVVTNPRAAAGTLKQMLTEMEARFERFAGSGTRNIQAYNELPDVERLPYIVIIIDELADLMMVAPADFEDVICRLAQMTRATGIHLVVATQRPSVDVITGLIKANIPSRLAFAVSSQVDSRTILDMPGAEKLLGKGDMLFMPIGAARAVRAQGAFIADSEIQALVEWWKSQGKPVYDQDLIHAERETTAEAGDGDELLGEAARLVVRAGYGSVSLLQRKMKIGYVRAARIVDQLEEKGIVGPTQGSNPREVLVGIDQLEQLLR